MVNYPNPDEFNQIRERLASKISQALELPPSAIDGESSSLEQSKIHREQVESSIKARNLRIDIDPIKLKVAMDEARSCLVELMESAVFKEFRRTALEAARQSRWATDPLNLMPYWNYLRPTEIRRKISDLLYDLARLVDPDLID